MGRMPKDMRQLMAQAQQMQQQLQAKQDELAAREYEGTAGGGVVKARVNGNQELQSVHIDPAAVDPDDVETLEDLVTGAVKQALAAARKLREEETAKITGGMNLPGLGF